MLAKPHALKTFLTSAAEVKEGIQDWEKIAKCHSQSHKTEVVLPFYF
jgi:hypothetical protein